MKLEFRFRPRRLMSPSNQEALWNAGWSSRWCISPCLLLHTSTTSYTEQGRAKLFKFPRLLNRAFALWNIPSSDLLVTSPPPKVTRLSVDPLGLVAPSHGAEQAVSAKGQHMVLHASKQQYLNMTEDSLGLHVATRQWIYPEWVMLNTHRQCLYLIEMDSLFLDWSQQSNECVEQGEIWTM